MRWLSERVKKDNLLVDFSYSNAHLKTKFLWSLIQALPSFKDDLFEWDLCIFLYEMPASPVWSSPRHGNDRFKNNKNISCYKKRPSFHRFWCALRELGLFARAVIFVLLCVAHHATQSVQIGSKPICVSTGVALCSAKVWCFLSLRVCK
jgi:hypothetical protein